MIDKARAHLYQSAFEIDAPSSLVAQQVVITRRAKHVHFSQFYTGIPIHNSDINVSFNADNEITFVCGTYYRAVSLANGMPILTGTQAKLLLKPPLNVHHNPPPQLVIFAAENGSYHLCWMVSCSDAQFRPHNALIDATTGLVRKLYETSARVNGTGSVFIPDPVTRSENTNLTDSSTPSEDTGKSLPNLAAAVGGEYRIKGDLTFRVESRDLYNNSENQLDAPGEGVTWTPATTITNPPVFAFTRNQSGFEEVNAYFHMWTFNNYLVNTLGVPGLSGKLDFDVHNYVTRFLGPNYTQFSGTHEIRFDNGGFPGGIDGVDAAEDADAVVHEFAHAVQRSYLSHSTWGGDDNLRMMQEGHADYCAVSYRRAAEISETLCPMFNRDYIGPWWPQPSDYFRQFNSTYKWPTDAVLGEGGNTHEPGGVLWGSTLMEIEEAIGRLKAMTAGMEWMSYLGTGATMQHAAHAYLQAYLDNFSAPSDMADLGQIVRVFARRGMFPTVQGELSSTQTWSGSRLVSGDVKVTFGVTLTISKYTSSNPAFEAGTVIAFASDSDLLNLGADSTKCELIVEGSLQVTGESGKRVRFLASGHAPTPPSGQSCNFTANSAGESDWYGISASGATALSIAYADIRFGHYGVIARDNDSGTNSVAYTTFGSNGSYDIYCGSAGLSSTLLLDDNVITVGGGTGIYLNGGFTGATISDNTITANSSSTAGMLLVFTGTTTPAITHNTITNATNGYGIQLSSGAATLTLNTIAGCMNGIYVLSGTHLIGTSSSSDNDIYANTQGIKVYASSCSVGPVTIRNNQIHDNSTGVNAYNTANVDVGTSASHGKNSFYNNGSCINEISECGTVMAEYNWFGYCEDPPCSHSGSVDASPALACDAPPASFEVGVEPAPNAALIVRGFFPNPTRSGGVVRFHVRDAVREPTISVFSVDGKLVRQLLPGPLPGGEHAIQWDGRSSTGAPVSDGIYFVQVKSTSTTGATSKVLVVR